MRPRSLDEVVGQDLLVGPGGPLRALAQADELPSLILWGPPGCGKTTLARLLAAGPQAHFEALSAVTVGVKEIRAVVERARRERGAGRRTVLLLDELHRFNRAQQDALLPHVEAGPLTLIGATTENPSFEVNAPLLSRCRVYTLERLEPDSLAVLVRRAVADPERGFGRTGLGWATRRSKPSRTRPTETRGAPSGCSRPPRRCTAALPTPTPRSRPTS